MTSLATLAPLPSGLTEPLHILEPSGLSPGWWIAMLMLAGGLAWSWYKRRRRPLEPAEIPTPQAVATGGGESHWINRLRRQFLETRDFRGGCHALAESVRQQLDVRGSVAPGPTATSRTATELEDRLGDSGISRFMNLLTDLQFSRREPSQSDFEGACDLADAVLNVDPSVDRVT